MQTLTNLHTHTDTHTHTHTQRHLLYIIVNIKLKFTVRGKKSVKNGLRFLSQLGIVEFGLCARGVHFIMFHSLCCSGFRVVFFPLQCKPTCGGGSRYCRHATSYKAIVAHSGASSLHVSFMAFTRGRRGRCLPFRYKAFGTGLKLFNLLPKL